MLNKIIKFFLENKLITTILLVVFIAWGLITSPFPWKIEFLPKDPVAVDAIPDIGENQQIVFTKWMGRSPQDIEDQITYPLTTSLLGIPGVKTIRSSSMFGFSSIYIIFKDDIEFYWSRSRILEKLNSLPQNLLPDGVQPTLGPDATALGQIFWYTLEGRTPEGEVTGGWDLQELRSIQDFQVKYALASADGVSEVASIGGFVKEYQVDVDPAAMQANGVNLMQIMNAVKKSNLDIGARTIEINQAEYFVRGIGYVKQLADLEEAVVKMTNNTPVRIKDVARVSYGPSDRRGVLDKMGAEVVGGVVVARYGANPLEVINNVKAKIEELAVGLPEKQLADGSISKLTIVPFYDRTQLIYETLGTLEDALTLEIIITIIVIIIMVLNLRASILISALIPIAVLMTFIGMRYFHIDANIVALSGIAIAIGTIVDVGIVLSENMIRHLEMKNPDKNLRQVIFEATTEVAPAVITAVLTTIVSFIPVFSMEAAEGKLFRPLAFTKTFVLIAALVVAVIILPAMAHWLFAIKTEIRKIKIALNAFLVIMGFYLLFASSALLGITIIVLGAINFICHFYQQYHKYLNHANILVIALSVSFLLAREWLPLGASNSLFSNFIFVILSIALLLTIFLVFIRFYQRILNWALKYKLLFLSLPSLLILWAVIIWLGFANTFGFLAHAFDKIGINITSTSVWKEMYHKYPGIGKEFMPALDEGSFLLMPTSMPHAGMEENKRVLQLLDLAVANIPEIDMVVGKLGRVESALDPAPISMYENVINYKSEYKTDAYGKRIRFALDEDGNFLKDENGEFIPDDFGEFYRQWRDHIKSPDDIWQEIVNATKIPGVTSAPKLQPIETRLVMLQTGMRAPIGIKVLGSDLKQIESFGLQLEKIVKDVPGVNEASVFAERMVGKPYLEIKIDRKAIARFGLQIEDVQKHLAIAVGGMTLTNSVEGRERYPIRVRYPRELRNDPDLLKKILIPTSMGKSIPLEDLATIEYVQGPQVIKSENTFQVGYVIFDKEEGYSEVDIVEDAQSFITNKIESGELEVPAGVSFQFTGNYENQIRAEKRLGIVIPVVLIIIFLILYFQFRGIAPTLMVFSGIAVAFAGGFIMIWLYGQDWFLNFSILGINLQDLFQVHPVYLSVAVWVGFIALFGIATDDGVIMASYLEQEFKKNKPKTISEIRLSVIEAGKKRIRPCLMTTATTLLALLPILTSTGRGADVMIPMAIPAFGGMTIALITLFVVPVLYAMYKEIKLKKGGLV
ncbi:efflux RND transporter permease subunit [Marinifilum sp. JC070]|uniref:Efflux RND transporter permease subunit n=2 Tax=Marinifilum caeruleilacunae TaxID=2499076 RepID=A0ABX1WY39_9BACT|nr:efflux RND transporter permease subunit [Marinifilum caeruleilacunae]NOU60803.1 efflux RND transporter permease subunit [Marinifilum caeruleilacunae]